MVAPAIIPRAPDQEVAVRGRMIRASVAAAALLLIAGPSLPGWTAPRSGSAPEDSAVRVARAISRGDVPADIDRRVRAQVARGQAVDALLILDGVSALASATAFSDGDSQTLLRSVVPIYRALKDDIRSRMPSLTVLRDYRTLPIIHVRLSSRAALRRAAADPAVIGIAANRRYRPTLTESLPLIGQPAAVAAGHTGAGTAVAVLDTGLNFDDPAFGNCAGGPGSAGCRVVVARDFAPNDGELDDPSLGLHGTNVSGIVAGVAPGVNLLGLDVFDGDGAFNSDILDAIDFSIANQATFNIVAMNLSLGDVSFHTTKCGGAGNPFVSAFANARAAGMLPVVASGNDAAGSQVGVGNPACTPGALSVGAVYDSNVGGQAYSDCTDPATAADQITCFSQTASFLTVLSPGARITAAGITQSGTSQATPHVAGAVAALVDSLPTATPDMIQTAIGTSGPLIFDDLIGLSFHRLDLPAAIATLAGLPPPPGGCTVFGTGGNDLLEDTTGDDVICGEGGSDTIVLSNGGNDVVDGGPGFDFITLELASSGGTINLGAGTAVAGGVNATVEDIEGMVGTPFADALIGDGGGNDIFGLGGNDDINGMAGADFVRFDFSNKKIKADLVASTARGEGRDDLVSMEGFVGSSFNDEVLGSNKANVFFGLGGNDLLAGFGKPDELFGGPGVDGLFGGTGNDDMFGGPGNDFCDQGPGSGTASSC